ncbi:MAG: DUF3576 domain-containing protein [Rhodospirillales bacterium]
MRTRQHNRFAFAVVLAATTALVACEGAKPEGVYPNRDRNNSTPYEKSDSLFGPGGASLGLGGGEADQQMGGGVGVNGFLWRASLDTVAFMPVASADPFGGVIITDWYAMPEAPGERFKLNVYILSRSLRADGVRVAVFRQIQDGKGGWQDASLASGTDTRIEEAILTRARQLRFDTLQGQQG